MSPHRPNPDSISDPFACFHPVTTALTTKFLHGASFAISFLVISYFHVVLGEVVPNGVGRLQFAVDWRGKLYSFKVN